MQSNLKTTLFIAAATLFVIAGTQAQAGGDTAGQLDQIGDAVLVENAHGD